MSKWLKYSLFFLFILVFLFTCYYVFFIDHDDVAKLEVNYKNDNHVLLKNTLPVSDQIGKNYTGDGVEKNLQEYKEFEILNNNDSKINYVIYIKMNKVNTKTIKNNYVKLYLTDEYNHPFEGFDENKVPALSDLLVASDKPDMLVLYKGTLVKGAKQKFKFRVWLSDSYDITTIEAISDFNIEIKNK